MERPDKIYITFDKIIGGIYSASRHPENVPGYTDFEYISKSTLLEWAKERYNHYSLNPGKTGERDVCCQLIEMLNSL